MSKNRRLSLASHLTYLRIMLVVKSSTECVGEELDVLYNRSPTQTFQSDFATSWRRSILYFTLGNRSFQQTPFKNICHFVYIKISNSVALTELEISQNQDTHGFHWALSVFQSTSIHSAQHLFPRANLATHFLIIFFIKITPGRLHWKQTLFHHLITQTSN